MAEVGFAAAIISLVKTAKEICIKIKRLSMNAQKKCRLLESVVRLTNVLESAGGMSSGAADLVRNSLQEVKSTLESIAEPRQRDWVCRTLSGFVIAEPDEAKLVEVERRLQLLETEVLLEEKFLRLQKEFPSIYNEEMEIPESAGASLLNRAAPILEFLGKSKSQKLRVIGIHGMPGVGKSTLLNYIWREALTPPFLARAHLQIGHRVTPQLVCSLQSSIMQQLSGERTEFTSLQGGKERLRQHFQQLKALNKPVFLAIDNIFSADDVRDVLPFDVSAGVLPGASCIAVTCRDVRVIEALLRICNLHHENNSQVMLSSPQCLNLEDSREVFAHCGRLCVMKDAELLDNLVPLCRGLPLALTILGKMFAGHANKRKDWKRLKEKLMQDMGEDDAGAIMAIVEKSFGLSYEQLGKRHKAAFLDVVNFFYGWPWEIVEKILGVSVLRDLKYSSLISEADGLSTCNQSALREGSGREAINFMFVDSELVWDKRVVTMHDLILQFGKSLGTCDVARTADYQLREDLLRGAAAHPESIRNLMLWEADDADAEVEFVERTRSLQMLQLHATMYEQSEAEVKVGLKAEEMMLFKANYYTHSEEEVQQQALRYLSLVGWNTSRRIMQMKISSKIRVIHLYGCQDVKELPDTPLCELEWLQIRECANFRGFSSACVKNWYKLKCLVVTDNAWITSIPAELGHLKSLKHVRFVNCLCLGTFPSLCNAEGPSHLVIEYLLKHQAQRVNRRDDESTTPTTDTDYIDYAPTSWSQRD